MSLMLYSKRPYKDPWPLKKAVTEIKQCAGKHFDPRIVEAFLTLDKKNRLKKYSKQLPTTKFGKSGI